MNVPRETLLLARIRQACEDALVFTAGMDRQAFLLDRKTQQAVAMSLMVIGEAVAKLVKTSRISSPVTLKRPGPPTKVRSSSSSMIAQLTFCWPMTNTNAWSINVAVYLIDWLCRDQKILNWIYRSGRFTVSATSI